MSSLSNPIADVSQNLLYFPQRVILCDQSGNAVANQDNLVALASATYSANTPSSDLTNYTAKGVVVFLSPGTVTGASATVKIQGKDPASGTYYDILTSATIASSTFQTLTVYPGNTVTANVSASTVLPKTWRINLTGSGWGSITTLSVAYCYVM